jgi:hypothetical protein
MVQPDYAGGGILNLMTSVIRARDGRADQYAPLRGLEHTPLNACRTLILLVIDGLGFEFLRRQGDSVLRRHLHSRITSVFPSTTATAVTTFLTGLAPAQHAFTGWHIYFREVGAVVAVLPFKRRGAARAEPVDRVLLRDHTPVFRRLPVQSYVVTPAQIAHSAFNEAHTRGAIQRPYATLAELFVELSALARSGDARQYVYAYYPDIDRLAHDHGIGSDAVAGEFAELDRAFAQFLRHIQGTDTVVLVTADHGFIDSSPQHTLALEAHPALARTLIRPLSGERRVAYCYVNPPQRATFEHYATTTLAPYATLVSRETLMEQAYFGPGTPHPCLHERIGDYALIMKENYIIEDSVPGESPHRLIGVHGGMSAAEMHVPLILARA